jgi:hypothetical protein
MVGLLDFRGGPPPVAGIIGVASSKDNQAFFDIAVYDLMTIMDKLTSLRTYHSSKSARDRDCLRQSVLEELNWRIHRVWSTDWYRDPEREFNRLVQKIESLREIAEPDTAARASR